VPERREITAALDCLGIGFGRSLEMKPSLADTLNRMHADPDTVQQGLRLYLSEQTGDMTPRQMLAELKDAASDPGELERSLKRFESDPAALNQAALLSLGAGWENPESHGAIEASLRHAKESLPVIELSIMAIVAMYAMYRTIRAQPVKETVITEWDGKGKYTQTRITEHEPFLPIASALTGLFKARGTSNSSTST
jgi:hypothetical protein